MSPDLGEEVDHVVDPDLVVGAFLPVVVGRSGVVQDFAAVVVEGVVVDGPGVDLAVGASVVGNKDKEHIPENMPRNRERAIR